MVQRSDMFPLTLITLFFLAAVGLPFVVVLITSGRTLRNYDQGDQYVLPVYPEWDECRSLNATEVRCRRIAVVDPALGTINVTTCTVNRVTRLTRNCTNSVMAEENLPALAISDDQFTPDVHEPTAPMPVAEPQPSAQSGSSAMDVVSPSPAPVATQPGNEVPVPSTVEVHSSPLISTTGEPSNPAPLSE